MCAVSGPFDIVGDVHGCADELEELVARLGYAIRRTGRGRARRVHVTAPHGRRAVFVGDLVDRGPRSPDVLRLVMAMVEAGVAIAMPGNHDVKFWRWLDGRKVRLTHGLERTAAQLEGESAAFREKVRAFLAGLPTYAWLDCGGLAVAHAGIKEEMLGLDTADVRRFCLYGETSGETDEFGLPVRYHWAADYRGRTAVVYGHTPVPEAIWGNNTICIDTGCCFGGRLSALRWPEREVVAVKAAQTYAEPVRPFGHPPPRPGAIA
jgi:protein phosphatase